nr:putative ring finger protein [Quercus suber]
MTEMRPGYPSRKRQRTSQGTVNVILPANTTVCSPATLQSGSDRTATTANGMGTTNAPMPLPAPCQHQQSLTSLLTDVNAMRNLITCQICHNPMYEPFSLACGHTYCYSCLSQWLGHNKSCPDCRTRATQQPVPSYLVREMVLVLISRTQLLPDGETLEDHAKNAREEAGLVAQDRANTDPKTGGLFKGAFNLSNTRLMPVHDPGDDVDRCPNCHWELEDLYCIRCDHDFDANWDGDDLDLSEEDEESSDEEDLDHDLDAVDQDTFGLDGVEHGIDGIENQYLAGDFLHSRGVQAGGFYRHGRQYRHGQQVGDDNDDDSDESSLDEESEGSMSGFINDDTIPIEQSSDLEGGESDSTVQEVASSNARGRRTRRAIIVSDDDDNDTSDAGDLAHGEIDDDLAGATNRSRKITSRPSQRLVIDSDSDAEETSNNESDSELEDDEETGYSNPVHFATAPIAEYSPLQQSETTDERSDVDGEDSLHPSDDEFDEESDDDVDDEVDDADTTGVPYDSSVGFAYHDSYEDEELGESDGSD